MVLLRMPRASLTLPWVVKNLGDEYKVHIELTDFYETEDESEADG